MALAPVNLAGFEDGVHCRGGVLRYNNNDTEAVSEGGERCEAAAVPELSVNPNLLVIATTYANALVASRETTRFNRDDELHMLTAIVRAIETARLCGARDHTGIANIAAACGASVNEEVMTFESRREWLRARMVEKPNIVMCLNTRVNKVPIVNEKIDDSPGPTIVTSAIPSFLPPQTDFFCPLPGGTKMASTKRQQDPYALGNPRNTFVAVGSLQTIVSRCDAYRTFMGHPSPDRESYEKRNAGRARYEQNKAMAMLVGDPLSELHSLEETCLRISETEGEHHEHENLAVGLFAFKTDINHKMMTAWLPGHQPFFLVALVPTVRNGVPVVYPSFLKKDHIEGELRLLFSWLWGTAENRKAYGREYAETVRNQKATEDARQRSIENRRSNERQRK